MHHRRALSDHELLLAVVLTCCRFKECLESILIAGYGQRELLGNVLCVAVWLGKRNVAAALLGIFLLALHRTQLLRV